MKRPRIGLLWLPLALFVGIAGFQILGPVPVGLADNRDFARVLGPLRLWPVAPFKDNPHLFFDYFVNDYVVRDPIYDLGVPSSESLLAAAAKEIATIVLPAGTFQLSLIGLLHAAFYALALFIVLNALRTRAAWVRFTCGLLLVFIWTDRVTVWQFNTAYTDAGALSALVVLFAIAVRCLLVDGGWPWGLAFVLFGCFVLGTKTQHLTAVPFLIAFCLLAGFRIRRKRDRIVWLTAPVLLVVTTFWMVGHTVADYRAAPAFTVVFHKLTVLAPDPKTVLADFCMPEEEFLKYVGQYAYQPGVPMNDPAFRHRIVSLVTPSSLGSFYWRHPGITAKVVLFDLRQSAPDIDFSRWGYGHLRERDVRSGKHAFELTAWSRFRHRLFVAAPLHPVWLFGSVLLFTGLCLIRRWIGNWFPLWPVISLSALLAISSFVFASLTDAAETFRHLVFFQTAMDLTIFSILLSICLRIEDRGKRGSRAPRVTPRREGRTQGYLTTARILHLAAAPSSLPCKVTVAR